MHHAHGGDLVRPLYNAPDVNPTGVLLNYLFFFVLLTRIATGLEIWMAQGCQMWLSLCLQVGTKFGKDEPMNQTQPGAN